MTDRPSMRGDHAPVYPPIKPGGKLVAIPDVAAVTALFDEDGQDLGLFLLAQTGDDFLARQPLGLQNQLRIGSRFAPKASSDHAPDAVMQTKVIANPRSGRDELLVVSASGQLTRYGLENSLHTLGQSQLPNHQLQSGDCCVVGFQSPPGVWPPEKIEALPLLTVLKLDGDWCLISDDTMEAYPIALPSTTRRCLSAEWVQYGLSTRLLLWCEVGEGTPTMFHNIRLVDSVLVSFDLNEIRAYTSGEAAQPTASVTALDTRLIVNDARISSTAMAVGHYEPAATNEQVVIHYYVGTEDSYIRGYRFDIFEFQTDDTGSVSLERRVSHDWPAAGRNAAGELWFVTPEIRSWITPTASVFFCAAITGDDYLGTQSDTYVSMVAIQIDWSTNLVAGEQRIALPITGPVNPIPRALVHDFGLVMRPRDATTLDIMFVAKTGYQTNVYTPQEAKKLTMVCASFSAMVSEAREITWSQVGWFFDDMRIWHTSQDPYDDGMGSPDTDSGAHQMAFFSIDWVGNSLCFGEPTLSQQAQFEQLMGLYQVPPFQQSVQTAQPQLTVSQSTGTAITDTVTQHDATSHGVSDSAGVTIFGQTISDAIGATWTTQHVKTASENTNIDVHLMVTFSEEDGLHAVGSFMTAWTYPVTCRGEAVGTLTVLSPGSTPTPGVFTTSHPDFFYDQDYEVGMLLSYVTAEKSGYDVARLMFSPITLPVLGDSASIASVNYDITNTTMTSDQTSTDVSISASAGVTLACPSVDGIFSGSTSLQYQLNKSAGASSIHDVSTSNTFSLSFNLGNVNDAVYSYEVTPLVYRDESKIIRIKYDVNLSGVGWSRQFSKGCPAMFRVFPFSQDPLFMFYTRSIQFLVDETTGDASIRLKLFNNGYGSLDDVALSIYEGIPTSVVGVGNDGTEQKDLRLLKTLSNVSLEAIGRTTIDFPDIRVSPKTSITVQLMSVKSGTSAALYWGCYPYNHVANLVER